MNESTLTWAETTHGPRHGRILHRFSGFLALLLLAGCGDGSDPTAGEDPVSPDDELRAALGARSFGEIPYPADNPFVPERVELGRTLFFDPILSGETDVACATCHLPEFAFTDRLQFAVGVGGDGLGPERTPGVSRVSGEPVPTTIRNTTTVLNTGMAHGVGSQPSPDAPLFWDGRAQGLEDQALQPLVVREEMRGDALPGSDEDARDSLVLRLRAIPDYVEAFSAAFPEEAASAFDSSAVTANTLARALAAYQRELVTREAPYDRWVAGDDDALTALQKEGMELFLGRARCFVCHADPLFGSDGFFVTGVPSAGRGGSVIPGDDTGREEHTGDPADRYAFRAPSLRNVALTPPYMHSGVFTSLEEVVAFYNDGQRPRHPEVSDQELSAVLQEPPDLTGEEQDAVVAFLEALTDPGDGLDPSLLEAPDLVPSGLSYRGESANFIVMASIAAGGWHSCAVSGRGSGVPNGTVYCWGRNDQGQLGIGSASSGEARVLPVRVGAPSSGGGLGGDGEEASFFNLTAGLRWTCGRTLLREIYCWGGGVVGGGNLRPALVESQDWEILDGGDEHVCAVTGDGGLFCWGENGHGQLGDGSTVSSVVPRRVPGGPWAAVSAGARHTCALTRAGQAFCWGDDAEGQLGDGARAGDALGPVAVAGGHRFGDVSAGASHSCAVDDGGRVWCWGSNERGQLGRPLELTRAETPREVEAPETFRSVASGLGHTCAASSELEAWCWGANGDGELGRDGVSAEPGATPDPVRTSRRFAELSAGLRHTCAIENARGWCWGANGFGQVGNGGTVPNLVPGVVVGKP